MPVVGDMAMHRALLQLIRPSWQAQRAEREDFRTHDEFTVAELGYYGPRALRKGKPALKTRS